MQYIEHYNNIFNKFDPGTQVPSLSFWSQCAQGSVALSDIEDLVVALGEPLGRSAPVDPGWLEQIIEQLELLPSHIRGRANFSDLWNVLTTSMPNEQADSPMSEKSVLTREDVSIKVAPEASADNEQKLEATPDVSAGSKVDVKDNPLYPEGAGALDANVEEKST